MGGPIGKNKREGSITVFLTLTLVLILSLLFTTIEGARIGIAKSFAKRALSTAMDSILAEYYHPLMEDYHILALDAGYGADQIREDMMKEALKEYMSFNFEPNQKKKTMLQEDGIDLYNISVEELSIVNQTRLMDYKGELFINEAIEYMKYAKIADVAETFLNQISMYESPQKVSKVYEEKQKVEESLVEIDRGLLQLMKLLDGVKTSKKGLEVTKLGALKTEEYFVKKICFGNATMNRVSINNQNVFQALKGNYKDPYEELSMASNRYNELEELRQKLNSLHKEKDSNRFTIELLTEEIVRIEQLEEPTEEELGQKVELEEKKKALDQRDTEIVKTIEQYGSQEREITREIRDTYDRVLLLLRKLPPKIDEALQVIDKILDKTHGAEGLLNEFEELLYEEQESIGEEIFQGIHEELLELKRYTDSDTKNSYNFPRMQEILHRNYIILSVTESFLYQSIQELDASNYLKSKENLQIAMEQLSGYQIKELKLDYSSIVLTKEESKNPLNAIQSLIQNGLMSLVIDPDSMSKAKISEASLPSMMAAFEGETNHEFEFDLGSMLDNAEIGKTSGMSNAFHAFAGSGIDMDLIMEGIEGLIEKILFQEYLMDHFHGLQKKENFKGGEKPTVLSYEMEYLLVGKMEDKENLGSIISQLILIRMIMNFVSILTDQTKGNEARLAATALVGFTGLPILISITKTIILMLWSLAEAFVDTCAILQGKSIPLLKNKQDFVMELPDLFLLNRTHIEKRAREMKDDSSPLGISYQEYLRFFLFLKKKEDLSYRSMDLIQSNMQLRYEDSFYIQNCLYGFQVEASFLIKSKFTQLPIVRNYTRKNPEGFLYQTSCEYSY